MKHSIIGSLVGIAIVFALDSFVRVIIATYSGLEILMFSYSSYPGIMWPVALTIFAGLTSFLGGMFSLTYGRSHKGFTTTIYVILLILVRYGQIHLLLPTESLFYPITALVLSLGGAFFAWQFSKDKPAAESSSKNEYHQPAQQNSGDYTGAMDDPDQDINSSRNV